MGALSWLLGVGVPTLAGIGLLVGAAFAWFRLPVIGGHVAVVLAMIGVAIIANARGFSDARALCKEAAVRAELEQAKRDLAISRDAAANASKLSDALNRAEQTNAALVNEIAAMPVRNGCAITADDRRRLLGIR